MAIKGKRAYGGKTFKGEYRQTRYKGLRFFTDKTLKSKGDFAHGFDVDPSPIRMAKAVGGLPKRFDNLKELWPKIIPVMRAMLRHTNASGSEPDGSAWALPDEKYVKRKKREGYSTRQVVRSGTLRDKLGEVVTKTKTRLSVGIKKLPYARMVNFGFQAGFLSRVFMGWTKAGTGRVNTILGQWHKKQVEDLAAEIRRMARGST